MWDSTYLHFWQCVSGVLTSAHTHLSNMCLTLPALCIEVIWTCSKLYRCRIYHRSKGRTDGREEMMEREVVVEAHVNFMFRAFTKRLHSRLHGLTIPSWFYLFINFNHFSIMCVMCTIWLPLPTEEIEYRSCERKSWLLSVFTCFRTIGILL